MNDRKHWEHIYRSRSPEQMGWYLPKISTSLNWIRKLNLPENAPLLDVGSGASTLVDELIQNGFINITVVDISEAAISVVKRRLNEKSNLVNFTIGDVRELPFSRDAYRLWHDRAVFHFLITEEQRARYYRNLLKTLQPGGYFILATFASEAPPKCSGLPVQRYNVQTLKETFGDSFELRETSKEKHFTPDGTEQMYLYGLFQKRSN